MDFYITIHDFIVDISLITEAISLRLTIFCRRFRYCRRKAFIGDIFVRRSTLPLLIDISTFMAGLRRIASRTFHIDFWGYMLGYALLAIYA